MELNNYQEMAMTTCMPSCENFSYMFLNLVGEVGEFSSKVAKYIRKGRADVRRNHIELNISDEELTDLKNEVGDMLWQTAGLCKVMGWSLEDVAQMNLNKLSSRQKRGVIDGNGDNR